MASRKKPTKSLAFDEVFVQIRPNILFVKDPDVAEYLYDPISSEIEADSYETAEPDGALAMTSCHIVVSAFLDGGLAFIENEWGDGDSHEAAFEQWVSEREAAGGEWDEDDFVYQPTINYEGPPLLSGCYVIGIQVITACLGLLPATITHVPQHLGLSTTQQSESGANTTNGAELVGQAEAIARKLTSCSWDELTNPFLRTEDSSI